MQTFKHSFKTLMHLKMHCSLKVSVVSVLLWDELSLLPGLPSTGRVVVPTDHGNQLTCGQERPESPTEPSPTFSPSLDSPHMVLFTLSPLSHTSFPHHEAQTQVKQSPPEHVTFCPAKGGTGTIAWASTASHPPPGQACTISLEIKFLTNNPSSRKPF